MSEADAGGRLPTALWLEAQLRLFEQNGGFYTIIQRGEAMSGTVIALKRERQNLYLYQQNRNFEGILGWLRLRPRGGDTWVVEQSWADAYIQRAAARDPDVWVVELDSSDAAFPLEGPVFDELG